VTILNRRSVTSRETAVRNGIKKKSWIAHLLSSAEQQEAIGGSLIQQKVKDYIFTARLRIRKFRTTP
jgi:hypothetical protein